MDSPEILLQGAGSEVLRTFQCTARSKNIAKRGLRRETFQAMGDSREEVLRPRDLLGGASNLLEMGYQEG